MVSRHSTSDSKVQSGAPRDGGIQMMEGLQGRQALFPDQPGGRAMPPPACEALLHRALRFLPVVGKVTPREDHVCWLKIKKHTVCTAQVGNQVQVATWAPRIYINTRKTSTRTIDLYST